MRLHRRPELRHSSGRHYVDAFAAVSPRWTLRAGTLAAGLQASAMANWLGNLVVNGEFTSDVASWSGVIAQRDSTVTPGVNSGGVDVGCLELTAAGGSYDRSTQLVTVVPAYSYKVSARVYSPSANTRVNAGGLRATTILAYTSTTVEDTWQIITGTGAPVIANMYIDLAQGFATAAGDLAFYDSVTLYRQNAVATLAGWGSPNIVATLSLPQPAAPSVVPFSFITRYVDALNYWEVRVTPNTAGNDCEIIEVVAGVPTVRAAADIDWTASQTDQVRVKVLGASIAVEAQKFGAGAFTAAASYATMATGLTATNHGLMFFGTGVNRITRWESHT